ncbi:MAG: methionyl-tRNA formyltransferase [Parachlamydiaceae bacterium]|nr:methionyl-tRNA formyltransferase [Parachlamydiaceae bacterium]
MKVVFFGTPAFAAEVLQFLIENNVTVVAVVTKPDRPKGRSGTPQPTPVKVIAQNHSLPIFQPVLVSADDFKGVLEQFQADLFVVVAYGEIIKQHLLDMPKLGCINLHASLLPKYRGAAPIQHSILNGDPKTGVTIMHMVKKMDAGDMIKVAEVPIGPDSTFPEIERALCEVGKTALYEVIQEFAAGKIAGIPQDHALATLSPKIELEDCEIKWDKSAQQLHNLVRAVTPEPGAWCQVMVRGQNKRLKIYRSHFIPSTSSSKPGTILSYGKEGLTVACGSNALRILELQLEGKKTMSAEELMCGISRDQLVFI